MNYFDRNFEKKNNRVAQETRRNKQMYYKELK